ncbi:hypothetical protein V8G56_13725 [Gaetbulibacter aquiaggeris]|uniref:Secreted protein n=1 Tax=Gaetbulibacter aquiaggeris TaxID=1735373 RepID=A0ABW7MSJ2_9FLAO
MKTTNRLSLVLVFLLFFVITTSFSQQTHYITLHVNTEQINSQNELETCYFTSESPDGQVITSSGNIQEFTTVVNAGDTIVWRGQSSNDPDNHTVNISSINYHGGDNVFDQNVLNGNGGSPEEVVGVVKVGTNGQTEKYAIKFKVFNNGNQNGGTFNIDPKISVQP